MITTSPGLTITNATLENAPAGLTITARLQDGDETLPGTVTVTPKLDTEGDPLDAYTAAFTVPDVLPVMLQWLQGATVVGSELVVGGTIVSGGPFVRTFYFDAPESTIPFVLATMQEAAVDADLTDPLSWSSIELFDPLPAPETDGSYEFTTDNAALDPTAYYRMAWATSLGAVFNSDPVLFPDGGSTARTLLASMTSADTEPTLSIDDLNALLELARIPDSLGLAATDTAWTPTYDFNFAAAEGWRWKAGKAAASYAFTMDGDSMERSFLHIRCKNMAEAYSKKIVTSVSLSTGEFIPPIVPLI